MKVIDLKTEQEPIYYCCLEDWSSEMKEAGNHKENWYKSVKNKGIRVKLALDEFGEIGGMIQYMPIEHSFFEGEGLYVILCIWVHGHKQGRGDFRKRGMGKALLKAAEEDAKSLGAKGLAAWGIILPFYMQARWFRKNGYKVADKEGIVRLMWKKFETDAKPPSILKRIKVPSKNKGIVNVTSFKHGWCPAQNIAYERAKRAIEEINEDINFTEINTSNKEKQKEWGIVDGLFVNDKEINLGPPPSYKKIKLKILKQVVKHSKEKE
jgi:GNAT superfamily N-acetyltransferase